nr:transposase [Candidatus Arsenophonus triatominarum]
MMDARWSVEVYHREVKQNCGIERCQARTSRAQRNHIFSLFLRGLNNINVVYLKK